MKAIAVDLGGTHATVALVEDRAILASEVIGLEKVNGLGAVLPLLAEAAYRVLSVAAVERSQASAFVLCFCGLSDPATGRVISTNQKYDDATRIDLPAWCQRKIGLPFMIVSAEVAAKDVLSLPLVAKAWPGSPLLLRRSRWRERALTRTATQAPHRARRMLQW